MKYVGSISFRKEVALSGLDHLAIREGDSYGVSPAVFETIKGSPHEALAILKKLEVMQCAASWLNSSHEKITVSDA